MADNKFEMPQDLLDRAVELGKAVAADPVPLADLDAESVAERVLGAVDELIETQADEQN